MDCAMHSIRARPTIDRNGFDPATVIMDLPPGEICQAQIRRTLADVKRSLQA